jgi:hypothetical protein
MPLNLFLFRICLPMDDLEKKIIEEYGTGSISPDDCNKILIQAAKDGFIEKSDIKPVSSMSTSQLIEHISFLRRKFLISDKFSLNDDDEVYDSVCSINQSKENAKIFDQTIRAFFEYEKIKTATTRPRYFLYLSIFIFILFLAFVSYTPAPY